MCGGITVEASGHGCRIYRPIRSSTFLLSILVVIIIIIIIIGSIASVVLEPGISVPRPQHHGSPPSSRLKHLLAGRQGPSLRVVDLPASSCCYGGRARLRTGQQEAGSIIVVIVDVVVLSCCEPSQVNLVYIARCISRHSCSIAAHRLEPTR